MPSYHGRCPMIGRLHSCNHGLDLILLSKGSKSDRTPSTATLFWDILTATFHKSEIWAFYNNISKLLGLSVLWTCLPIAHKI